MFIFALCNFKKQKWHETPNSALNAIVQFLEHAARY